MDRYFGRKAQNGEAVEPPKSKGASVDVKKPLKEKNSGEKTAVAAPTAPKTARYLLSEFSKLLEKDSLKPAKVALTATTPSPVPFGLIADAFELISKKSGQNSQEYKKEVMAKVFELVLEKSPEELVSVYDFCLLRTNVLWLQKDLGIGNQILTKAIVTVTGRTLAKVREDFQEKGCLGTVLEESRDSQNTCASIYGLKKKEANGDGEQEGKEMTTFGWVFETLRSLGDIAGSGSQAHKEETLVKLVRALTPREAKYAVRFVSGNLQIGFAEKMFQAALARALARFFQRHNYEYGSAVQEGDEFEDKDLFAYWEEALQKVFTQFPDTHTFLSHLIATRSLTAAKKVCRLTPGTPCKPMLAKPTSSLKQVFDRFENRRFTCEYKYDGLRGQIHYDRKTGLLRIFSRNLEDMTLQYPDIALSIGEFVGDPEVIEKVRYLAGQLAQQANLGPTSKESPQKTDATMEVEADALSIDSLIFDSEIVAYDRVKNRILSFQTLATRSRKNVNANDQVAVCIFIFDVLYFNGKPLINEPLATRRQVIRERVDTCSGRLKTGIIRSANYADCANIEELGKYLDESIQAGCEGLMVKTLEENATYEPAKRSFKWLKVKKDYLDRQGLGDSFDLVVVGAKFGEGKRAGKFGSYLMACYNQNSGDYECTVYVGGGFSDEQLDEFYGMLKDKALKEKPKNVLVEKDSYPNVWVPPELVFEIKAADILVSPSYKAARGELDDGRGSGLALRFARFIRWRKDKTAVGASDSKFMYDVYKSQALVKDADVDDDDYY